MVELNKGRYSLIAGLLCSYGNRNENILVDCKWRCSAFIVHIKRPFPAFRDAESKKCLMPYSWPTTDMTA